MPNAGQSSQFTSLLQQPFLYALHEAYDARFGTTYKAQKQNYIYI